MRQERETLTADLSAPEVPRKRVVRPLDRLDSYLMDCETICFEMREQIQDDAYRVEDEACLRSAEVLVNRLDALIDDLMAFQKEWIG